MKSNPSRPVRRTSADSRSSNLVVTSEIARGCDIATPARARMSRQRRRDTAPEMALRRELHRRGFRFRVDYPLPDIPRRRADIVFTRVRLAVFVDGCFWHDCALHGTKPKSRAGWWEEKLRKNVARDRDTNARLISAGWTVLRFWEHEGPVAAADRITHEYRRLRS